MRRRSTVGVFMFPFQRSSKTCLGEEACVKSGKDTRGDVSKTFLCQ